MHQYEVLKSHDFFDMLTRSLRGKCAVMREYPYLFMFCLNAYYEDTEEVKVKIQQDFSQASQDSLGKVLEQTNTTNLRKGFTLEEIYQEILYASDGFLSRQFRGGKIDVDQIEKGFMQLIELWKRAYSAEGDKI